MFSEVLKKATELAIEHTLISVGHSVVSYRILYLEENSHGLKTRCASSVLSLFR